MPKKINVEIWRGQVRMPLPLMEWVRERAERNFRTANAELLEIVREAMQREQEKKGGS